MSNCYDIEIKMNYFNYSDSYKDMLKKKKVGTDQKGGCYAGQGFTVFSWKATAKQKQEVSDAVKLSEWVKTLPNGSMIRHHVAGDIGK